MRMNTLTSLANVKPEKWAQPTSTGSGVLRLDHVFHVRLVGSLQKRAQHVQELNHLSKKAALRLIRREDQGRKRYLKRYLKGRLGGSPALPSRDQHRPGLLRRGRPDHRQCNAKTPLTLARIFRLRGCSMERCSNTART